MRKSQDIYPGPLILLERVIGFEPTTSCLGNRGMFIAGYHFVQYHGCFSRGLPLILS